MMPRRKGGRLAIAAATVTLSALVVSASAQQLHVVRSPSAVSPDTTARAAITPRPMTASVARLDELSDAFATVAARVKPSVVYITAKQADRAVAQTRQRTERGQRGTPNAPEMPGLPPEIQRLFPGMGLDESPDAPRAPHGGGVASGSGFIVSADGYVLTNNHVVEGASQVTVRLLDRREFRARVVGTDPTTDVAVLKIDATGLTPVPFGDSDASRVGEWVLAVGNPLGENLTFTVTQGIISAKGRALDLPNRSVTSIQDFIQTDAAINPGNSGGPLVNVRGEVIGINSAIESPTGYNAGYAFAVPINLARSVMGQIQKNGRVERAVLGVIVREATAEDAAYVGLKDISGVLVQDFGTDEAPAKKAGIEVGDVIVSIDGHRIDYVAQLQEAVAFRKSGDVVAVEVARKAGARSTIRVPLQRTPDDNAATNQRSERVMAPRKDDGATFPSLGITVAPAEGDAARGLELPADVHGVIVMGMSESSPAAGRLATPQTGGPDVILSVEGTPVTTPDALRSALRNAKAGEIVTLRVYNVQRETRRVERVRLGAADAR
jgi:serine protease Do